MLRMMSLFFSMIPPSIITAQAFDEMVGSLSMQTRSVLWQSWRGHDGGTVVAPTRGGGVSALWRMTGLLSRSTKGKPPANMAGGGWSDKEINALTNYVYTIDDPQPEQRINLTISNFDVVVFRVMHGWMNLNEITHDRIVEAVQLSHELLGATSVVLMTIPFTNNVLTVEDMIKVDKINSDIREIARGWHARRKHSTGGVQQVLVIEYGSYCNHIIWSNGRHLGYNVTHPLRADELDFAAEGPFFLLDRLHDGEWGPSIPQVCSDSTSLGPDRTACNRNYLFLDGMHVCPETLASRFAAGLACLLGCVYNGQTAKKTSLEANEEEIVLPAEENIRFCEKECNEQFLSVMPVEESWIDKNTVIASFSG
jgi:hypothetical protein